MNRTEFELLEMPKRSIMLLIILFRIKILWRTSMLKLIKHFTEMLYGYECVAHHFEQWSKIIRILSKDHVPCRYLVNFLL